MKSLLASARCIVVKVGSSLVTNDGRGLDQAAIAAWADQIARLWGSGVLVDSDHHIPQMHLLVQVGTCSQVADQAPRGVQATQPCRNTSTRRDRDL